MIVPYMYKFLKYVNFENGTNLVFCDFWGSLALQISEDFVSIPT